MGYTFSKCRTSRGRNKSSPCRQVMEEQRIMNICYDYYRIFYYTAKYRSITRAAKALFSNQPNVTRTIKNLEGELGCVLFIRSSQGVRLTPEGERLFEHVRIAFEHIEAGEEEIALNRTLQGGSVSIGASEVALHCFLLPILKEYRRIYPQIHIRVFNHSTPQAIEALKNGLVDIAVVTTPVDIPDALKCVTVKKFGEVAVCGPAFSYLSDKILSPAEISQLPLICLGEQTQTYDFYSDLFLKQGLPFTPSVEAATADQILPLVVNNLGIGFVPQEFLDNMKSTDAVTVLKLKEPIPQRSICYIKRVGFSLSIAAKKMEEMIKANC